MVKAALSKGGSEPYMAGERRGLRGLRIAGRGRMWLQHDTHGSERAWSDAAAESSMASRTPDWLPRV
jgi:hypothetical protein